MHPISKHRGGFGIADKTTEPTQNKQITVEVPEDRVAEFHAFFERFLAGRRRHRGRHGHRHGRCSGHSERSTTTL